MKKVVFVFLMLLIPALSATAQNEAVNWETDYKKARQMAQDSGKPLLINFTSATCKVCKMLDEQFWTRADVAEALKSFVVVKLNINNESSLRDRYGIDDVPYIAVSDSLGNLLTFRHELNPKNPDAISQMLKEVPNNFTSLKKLYDTVEANRDDGLTMIQIADYYANAKMSAVSNEFYKQALKTSAIQADTEKKERAMMMLGVNFYAGGLYSDARDSMESYLKNYPSGKYREITLAILAISDAYLGRTKESNKNFDQLKTEFPQSKTIETTNKAIEQAKKATNKP